MDKKNPVTDTKRRTFLKSALAATFGGPSLLSALSHAASAETQAQPYKALVCVLLAGGCDSFNLLMPGSNAGHKAYSRARTNLALDKGEAHSIRDERTGEVFGLHPATQKLQTLFEEKRLSLVANIGTLVEPTTKEGYLSGAAALPKGLLSHKDQIRHWQTSIPQDRAAKGWAGSVNDLVGRSSAEHLSRNVSLSGTNIYQYAKDISEYAITNKGSVGMEIFDSKDPDYQFVRRGVEAVLKQTSADPYKEHYTETIFSAQKNHRFFKKALAASKPVKTTFPDSDFGQNLRMIADTIAARKAIGAPLQMFFVEYGGWDHHDHLLTKQNEMLGDLAESLFAFDAAMQEIGTSESVTSFTISDFGRTLTSNGNGSDHGWGGNIMALGGAVRGGHVFGDYPDLTLGNDLDIGSGIFVPTLPTDALYASLGQWLGIEQTKLQQIMPNLGKFATDKQSLPLMRG